MSATRRQFLKSASLGAAALALPIPLFGQSAKPGAAGFSPSQWLRIGADGRTTLVVAHSEMGQGVRTSLAMILAEELEADWKTVVIEQASPGPLFTDTGTGGSDSVSSSWKPLREAGAAAREMLIEAAAKSWGVPPSACRAETGAVIHAASGRKAAYGDLVAAAAALPVPKEPRLKDPKDFRLLGTRVPRIDGPGIVSGRAVYGIDTRVPGMLYAAVAVCPVRGGKLARYDAAKAKAVPGVKDVVTIEGGVAVIAEDSFAALSGRDALGATWDEGDNGRLTTEELWKRIDRAAASPGLSSRKAGDAGAALAASATKLSAAYRTPFQAHATLEPGNTIAKVEGGACEVWSPTQSPGRVQKDVAKLLGIAPDKVTVHVTLLGGGFGRRLGSDYATQAVEVARAAKRPVQLVWSRADDFLQDRVHPAARVDLAAGLDATGRLMAWTHTATTFHLSMFGAFHPGRIRTGIPGAGATSPTTSRISRSAGTRSNRPSTRAPGARSTTRPTFLRARASSTRSRRGPGRTRSPSASPCSAAHRRSPTESARWIGQGSLACSRRRRTRRDGERLRRPARAGAWAGGSPATSTMAAR